MQRFSRRIATPTCLAAALTLACAGARSQREPAAGASVTSRDLQSTNEPVEVVLQRKVPGLVVTRTSDGGIALQVRGATSFRGGDAPPLYVLNGLPFEPGTGGALTGIDPNEIESIRVLKGPDAGIYGIQGANGAIVITTKMPGRKTSSP